jgi:hypothetical protein
MQSVDLTWDSSPSPNVAGYNVHFGSTSGVYTTTSPAGNTTALRLSGLVEGLTYYFVVTAYDVSNQESDLSEEVQYRVPGVPPPPAPRIDRMTLDEGTTLSWDPIPNEDVVGYVLYWGTESGRYDSGLFVTDPTITIPELAQGVTYYFAVTAITSSEGQSDYSVETAQAILNESVVELSIQPMTIDGFNNGIQVTASGQIPYTWTLEASANLRDWRPLITRSDPEVNVTIATASHNSLFFRLDSYEELLIQAGGSADFLNFVAVRTANPVPWGWTLQSSTDLQNWKPFMSGFFTSVNMVILTTPQPALFFRLKGE